MKHDFLDHHREGNSLVHRMDPRLKMILLIVYIFLVVTTGYARRSDFILYSLLPTGLILLTGISPLHFLGKFARLYPMIFLITFLIPFFPDNGSRVHHVMGLAIYDSGLQKFLLINMKSTLALLMSIVLIATTDFNQLLKGLEKLKVPALMIMILSFMYRFIFLLIDEAEKMQMSFQSRYIRLSLPVRLRIIAQQIGMLFIRTYERGERVALAMESRGFNGKIYTLNELRWRRIDSYLLLLFMLLFAINFLI